MGDDNAMRQNGEPSVEEILDSIKKVIARDSRGEGAAPRADAPAKAAPSPIAQPGVQFTPNPNGKTDLWLQPGPPPVEATVRAAPAPEPEPAEEVLELTEAEDLAVIDEPVEPEQEEATAAVDDEIEPLVAADAVASMRESLAALAMISGPGARPQIVRSGETSLEGLTRDLLRPMLAEWLDRNLPTMVEKFVAAEIARIARKGR